MSEPVPVIHPLSPLQILGAAGPLQKLVVCALLAAIVAAVVVAGAKLLSGRRLDGGSAFLSGLRLGGPIVGGLGACASLMQMTLGYASLPGDPPLKLLAPGVAEAFLQVGVGFLAGAVAVFAHWAVESRIDRQLLAA